jgi:quercetin dioxygenase-like cupin family protein
VTTSQFEYHRQMDVAAFAALAADERLNQKLLDYQNGGEQCAVWLIRTPAGGGSPEGLHAHPWEQIYYVLSGSMNVEVDGDVFAAGPGSLVVFPKGTPHRNWNTDSETLHLSINVPAPRPDGEKTRKIG